LMVYKPLKTIIALPAVSSPASAHNKSRVGTEKQSTVR
jgi:hypothetical protein